MRTMQTVNKQPTWASWSGTVDEQYTPYPRPQETGTKVDVRWLSLTNTAGTGLLVVAEQPIAASALYYTVGDLDRGGAYVRVKAPR